MNFLSENASRLKTKCSSHVARCFILPSCCTFHSLWATQMWSSQRMPRILLVFQEGLQMTWQKTVIWTYSIVISTFW